MNHSTTTTDHTARNGTENRRWRGSCRHGSSSWSSYFFSATSPAGSGRPTPFSAAGAETCQSARQLPRYVRSRSADGERQSQRQRAAGAACGGSEWKKLAHGAAGRRRPPVHAAIIAPRAPPPSVHHTTRTALADAATADWLVKFATRFTAII